MNKIISLLYVLIFALPLILGCQSFSTSSQHSNTQVNSKPFFTYPVLEPSGARTVLPANLQGEFRYKDGCLLVFSPAYYELLSPVFPSQDVTFNDKTKTLKILNTEYKMGEVVAAAGIVKLYDETRLANGHDFNNIPPEKCIKERLAWFYDGYEKTYWRMREGH